MECRLCRWLNTAAWQTKPTAQTQASRNNLPGGMRRQILMSLLVGFRICETRTVIRKIRKMGERHYMTTTPL